MSGIDVGACARQILGLKPLDATCSMQQGFPSLLDAHPQGRDKSQACNHYSPYLQRRGNPERVFDEGHFGAALKVWKDWSSYLGAKEHDAGIFTLLRLQPRQRSQSPAGNGACVFACLGRSDDATRNLTSTPGNAIAADASEILKHASFQLC